MSTETMESVGIATFTEIVEQMDFHLPCEHGHHETDTMFHSGDAEWQATETCGGCEPVSALVCDKWTQATKELGEGAPCRRCGQPLHYEFVKI